MEFNREPHQPSTEANIPNSYNEFSKTEFYTQNAFAKMNSFRKRGQLCDVVIKVGGREFLAHRVVLAATSDYFDAMFSNGMAESAQLEIELKSISPDIMDALLDYVYTGQVHVTMDNVQDLLPAASLVQMEGVKTACSDFLLAEVDASNVLGIRRFAELHSCGELEKFSRNYAAHNFELVVEFEEFLCLNHEELLDLVSREDLHVDCEESVYKAVMRWVHHQVPERSPHLSALLKHIRLPVMSVRFLTDIVDKDSLIRQSIECRDLVDDAKRYHLRPDLRHEMRERRYRQRDSGDEYLVVIGGFGSDQNPSDSVEMFNPRTSTWCELPDLPISYRYVAACSLDTCVYVIGGFDGRERLNTVCLLDIAHREEGWRWLSPMHFKRGLSAACTHKGLIYVCGGFDGQSRLRSLEVYHPKIDEWRILEDMNTAREGAGLVVADDTLYCLGGYDGFHLLNSMEAFDLARGSWTVCKPMYMRRSGAGCALLGDTIYVCGGYGGAEGRGPLHLDTVEAYNTRLQQWTLVTSMNVPRCYVGACPMAGKIYVAAGYNGNSLLGSVESYDPIDNQWWLHDDSRMNHERCDTGTCVVRFISCAEPPISNTQQTNTTASSNHSSSSTTTTTTASASTGQRLAIRRPLVREARVMGDLGHIRSEASRLTWSGSYPSRSHAPGMHAFSRLSSNPIASISNTSRPSSTRTPLVWHTPNTSTCQASTLPNLNSESFSSTDVLSRSFFSRYPWTARQLLAVSGVAQGSLNRWLTHFPVPQTLTTAPHLVPSSDSLRSAPPHLNTPTSFPNDSAFCPRASILTGQYLERLSLQNITGTDASNYGAEDTSSPFSQHLGTRIPGSLEDHGNTLTTSNNPPPLESSSSRESSSESPLLIPRSHHSAPENDLHRTIYANLCSSMDGLNGNPSDQHPWLYEDEHSDLAGRSAFPHMRPDSSTTQSNPRLSPASPDDLFGRLGCLGLNEDEDDVDMGSEDSVDNEEFGINTDTTLINNPDLTVLSDNVFHPTSEAVPVTQHSLSDAVVGGIRTTTTTPRSSPLESRESPASPVLSQEANVPRATSKRATLQHLLPRRYSALGNQSPQRSPGMRTPYETSSVDYRGLLDYTSISSRVDVEQPSTSSAQMFQLMSATSVTRAMPSVRSERCSSPNAALGQAASTSDPVFPACLESAGEPVDRTASRSDGEGEEDENDRLFSGFTNRAVSQPDQDEL